jgi:pathogenesis-related protein 1
MFSNQLFFAFAFVLSCLGLQLGVYALPAAVSTTNGPTRFPPPSPSDQISAFLDAHNAIRAQHNAADLKWSPYLARMAGFWTDQCQFKHTNGVLSNDPYGENVAAGTGDFPIDAAVATFVSDRGMKTQFPFDVMVSKFRMKVNIIPPIHPTCASLRLYGNQPRR